MRAYSVLIFKYNMTQKLTQKGWLCALGINKQIKKIAKFECVTFATLFHDTISIYQIYTYFRAS